MFNSFFLNPISKTPYNQFALFAGGFTPPFTYVPPGYPGNQNNGFFTAVTDKYLFQTGVVLPGTNLGLWRENLGGAGNYTRGILVGGDTPNINPDGSFASGSFNTDYTDKYTYITDVVAPGTVLGTGRNEIGGTGTAFIGLFAGGSITNGTLLATSEKYVYANDTISYGSNLQVARRWLNASSNPTLGIFTGGFINHGLVYVDLYTFSNDSCVPGTNMTTEQFGRTGTGNSSLALISAGYKQGVVTNNTDKYTYSNSTWTAGTNLGSSPNQLAAASDPNMAVIAGGVTSGWVQYNNTYTYADDSVLHGSNLATNRYCLAGLSTSPSGL